MELQRTLGINKLRNVCEKFSEFEPKNLPPPFRIYGAPVLIHRGGGVTEFTRVPVVAPAGTAPGYGCAKHRASLPGTVHSMLVGG